MWITAISYKSNVQSKHATYFTFQVSSYCVIIASRVKRKEIPLAIIWELRLNEHDIPKTTAAFLYYCGVENLTGSRNEYRDIYLYLSKQNIFV